MQVAFFDTHAYDMPYYKDSPSGHRFTFIEAGLSLDTVPLARGHEAVCVSIYDRLEESVLEALAALDVKLAVVRSSGVELVDFEAAKKHKITVKWLPGYSPEAIAEHAVALILTLNRKIHLVWQRVCQGDFSIQWPAGFNLYRKTIGIIGMGRVGYAFARIMKGFGCRLLAHDVQEFENLAAEGIEYTSLEDLLKRSDIISLHATLNHSNACIINRNTLQLMKPGAILINTARGGLVDTTAVLTSLKNRQLDAYGADVYEKESGIFSHTFKSIEQAGDPLLKELTLQPNVLLTAHQAFFTKEALHQMARTIINELTFYEELFLKPGSGIMA